MVAAAVGSREPPAAAVGSNPPVAPGTPAGAGSRRSAVVARSSSRRGSELAGFRSSTIKCCGTSTLPTKPNAVSEIPEDVDCVYRCRSVNPCGCTLPAKQPRATTGQTTGVRRYQTVSPLLTQGFFCFYCFLICNRRKL